MKTSTLLNKILAAIALLLAAPQLTSAVTTNVINFTTTTVPANSGPNNPANGVTTFNGTNLAVGDLVVFDGVVANYTGATGDNWGTVNLNAGGFRGALSAALAVLVRTGVSSPANACALYLNGAAGPSFAGTDEVRTNRVRIELTATVAGSTTNMNYLAEIDQGLTGTWTSTLTGSGVNFSGNSIALTFGSQNAAEFFAQYAPISVTGPTPVTNNVALGQTATFTAIINGFPLNTAQQWRKNGSFIAGATNTAYTTPATLAGDNGAHYDLVVTNLNNPANTVTSAVATLVVRTVPGIVTFDFPTTTVTAGFGTVTDPGVSISGSKLLAGDTVVFDGIVVPNGAQASDAWTAINIAGAGYGNVISAKLGVLTRLGTGPSQLFINAGGGTNPTSGGSPTNRVRIELYPSASGSTTNMGWLVKIDQNLSGTFQPAITGTNLTFNNNTLPLTFGSSGSSAFVIQDPQAVSIFSGPSPALQVVAVGAPATVGVTVKGWNPAFQWRRNGTTINNATNQTYTLPSASLSDNGVQFSVVVSNRNDSLNVVTSSVATVSVLIPNNLSWYPIIDNTTWDTVTANWTTNGGGNQSLFSAGNNVTFDGLGYNVPGNLVTVTNAVSANSVTVNATGGQTYEFSGGGSYNGQNLALTGDGTGQLGIEATATFTTATITSGILNVGYNGFAGTLQAGSITNNDTINFRNATGTLTIAGRFAGSGKINQTGAGITVLSATNSVYAIGSIDAGALVIGSAPIGDIVNNAELQPSSAADMILTNSMSGSGHYYFTGFQKTLLKGASTHTGINQIYWSQVTVDNAAALGDVASGATVSSGADRIGGLYLSNNLTWSQPLTLNPRQAAPSAAGTAPHLANASGTNDLTSPLTFANGQGGSELNVEAAAGQLTVDSVLANTTTAAKNLNLQGAATGVWNGALVDGSAALNVLKRGSGEWVLNGANTYSGTTTVSNGTLILNGQLAAGNVAVQSGATLGGTGVISGPVTIASGGMVAPGEGGIGLLTVTSNLTLSLGSVTSMEINKTAATKDQITGVNTLTYGGTLTVSNLSGILTTNDAFALFSAAAYVGAFSSISPATPAVGLVWNTNTLATDGTLRIVTGSTVATNPTNIMFAVTGGNTLQLTWPPDHIGWTLEVQTNSNSVGLGTNWVRIPTSSATNQVFIPVDAANGNVFYRLIYP